MSRWIQRLAINVIFLILTLIPLGITKLYFKWPHWACATVTVMFGIGMYTVVSNNFPRKALPYSVFIQALSRSMLLMLSPIAVMAVVYATLLHFQVMALLTNTATVIVGYSLFTIVAAKVFPQVVGSIVRGRAEPIAINGRDIRLPLKKDDTGLLWGGVRLPSEEATSHFMAVGTTGSGKTITIRLLIQEAFRTIGNAVSADGNPVYYDHRALIYDAKQDILSQLAGMGFACKIYTLNPFDRRGVCWDIARDITEPATAQQAASLLIPQDKDASQPFFVESAQILLYGVLLALISRGANWRFSDLVRAMQSARRIEMLLKNAKLPETDAIYERFFTENKETLGSIMSTVATKMTAYEPIAAMWDHAYEAGRTISLTHWLQNNGADNSILVLGNNEKARKPLDAINRVIFQRVTELILDQTEDRERTRRTWIVLDEVGAAGRLDGLPSLLSKGRSKGACVVLGFQDINTLKEVYGDNIANALTGQCSNKAILRLESPSTAEWATKLFGSYEAIEYHSSYTSGTSSGGSGGGSSTSVTYAEQYVKREAVLESEFYLLPVTNKETGLTGYYIAPRIGAYRHNYAGKWLFDAKQPGQMEPAQDVDDILRRDPVEQFLRAWTDEDYLHLGYPMLKSTALQQPSAAPAPPSPGAAGTTTQTPLPPSGATGQAETPKNRPRRA